MPRAERTRNANTMTEAAYWGKVRSALRKAFSYWMPAQEALKAAQRVSQSDNKRLKWEFQCASCREWFPRKHVRIDHVEPCGSLRCIEDLPGFLQRLTPENAEAFQCVCEPCHRSKTAEERKRRRDQ